MKSKSRPSNNYPAELRDRTVSMFAEVRAEYASDWKSAESIAEKLGIRTPLTELNGARKAQVDAGQRLSAVTYSLVEWVRAPRAAVGVGQRGGDLRR